jgi:cell division protein FtsL
VITALSPTGTQTEIQKLSEWMQTSGNKGDDLYKKLKSLVKGEKIEDEAPVEKTKPSKKEKVAE